MPSVVVVAASVVGAAESVVAVDSTLVGAFDSAVVESAVDSVFDGSDVAEIGTVDGAGAVDDTDVESLVDLHPVPSSAASTSSVVVLRMVMSPGGV
jgi:hypothetical protein